MIQLSYYLNLLFQRLFLTCCPACLGAESNDTYIPLNQLRHSVQFTCSVVSNSLWPRGLQHARLPCPSSTSRNCSNSCPSGQWCHPTISSSVVPFSSRLQSFLASGSFPMSQFFDHRIRWSKYWSFSFSINPSKKYLGPISFRMDWLDLLAVQGTLKSLPQHHSSKESILQCSAFFMFQLSQPYMTTGKTITLTRWTFAGT